MVIIQAIELYSTEMPSPTYRKMLTLVTASARVYMSSSRLLFCVVCFIIGNQLKSIGNQMDEGKHHFKEALLVENVQRQYTSGIFKSILIFKAIITFMLIPPHFLSLLHH